MGKRRWWVGLGLAIALVMALVSCRLQTAQTSTSTVDLTLWQGIGPPPNRIIFDQLVADFNRSHPHIRVTSRYVGHPDQQIPKILTAIVGNAAPDILWYSPTLTGELVELDALEPLDDWWQSRPNRDDLDPALLETMTFEARIWSIPLGANNTAVFYRPSLFQAAGITTPPRTWDDLTQAAQQLRRDRNGDGRIDQRGLLLSLGKGEWNVFVWLPWIYSAGGWLQQDDRPNLVNPGAIAALDFGRTLVNQDLALLSPPERGYELDPFVSGAVAMQITGPWVLSQLTSAGIDFDVFPLPQAQEPAAVLGGENLFLCRTSPEKRAAALEFFDYILSRDFQLAWATQTGFLPVTRSVQDSPEYAAFLAENPHLRVFLNQMAWARSRPLLPGYSTLSENLGRAIEATLLGTEAETALTNAQRRLDLRTPA